MSRQLHVLNNKPVEGTTCFAIQSKYSVPCERKTCQHWIEYESNCNCAIIAAQDGPKTLHDVGGIFNLTRMRICQIEKTIKKKIKEISSSST